MAKELNRRKFMKVAGGAAVAMSAASYERVMGANERISIGIIGCGSRGIGAHMAGVHPHSKSQNVEITAVCDPWPMQLKKGKKRADDFYGNKDCATYTDFRDMMARDDIDAISNATPDHWHCLVTLAAVRAGKHVHHEKAMGITVEEDIAVYDFHKKD